MKKRAIILVGYHYLSTPVYLALKEQLTEFELFYVFTKDTIGSDTNFKHFDRSELQACDDHYIELPYDPPWFTGRMTWHLRTKRHKLALWIRWIFSFTRFKREIMRLARELEPDVMITTSDMFFTPRYLAAKMPDIPVVVIQPCFVDLWERPRTFSLLRSIVNVFQPRVFERQQYFGMEIERAALLLWEPAAFEVYAAWGREATRVVSPTHLAIRDRARAIEATSRTEVLGSFGLGSDARVITFFPAYYGDVKGHGDEYQRDLETSLLQVLERLDDRFEIVIKVHPNEDFVYWSNVFAVIPDGRIRLVHDCDRFGLMAVSELHISTNSYAAVEATLSGTVSVNFVPGIDMIGQDFCRPFSRNAVVTCTSVDELVELLMRSDQDLAALRGRILQVQEIILGVNEDRPLVEDVLLKLTSGPLSASKGYSFTRADP